MKSNSIFSIILVIALLTISIFAAGCAETGPTDEEVTPTATATEAVTATPEPTIEVQPTVQGELEMIMLRIRHYNFLGEKNRQIKIGDTVRFINDEVNTHQTRCLISENGIWDEEQCITYRKSVEYIFNEPGEYSFYLRNREEATKLIITVV